MNMKKICVMIISLVGMTSLIAGEIIAAWTFNGEKNGIVAANDPAFSAETGNRRLNQNAFVEGLSGKALSVENGKYMLKVPHHDRLSLLNDFTIRCVVNMKQISGYRTIIWKGNRNKEPQQINYYLSVSDGKPEFKFKDAKGDWRVAISEKPLIEAGKWYLITVTMDGQGEVRGFLNGTPCFKFKYALGKLEPNAWPVFIGGGESADGSPNYPLDGMIEEITIMRGVVPPTAQEIEAFNHKLAPYNEKQEQILKTKKQALLKTLSAASGTDFATAEQLEKMTLSELTELNKKCDYRRIFQRYATDNPILLSVLPTANRIVNLDAYISGKMKLVSQIELSAAQNESEGFQIILMGNPQKTVSGITVTLSALKSDGGSSIIPAEKLEWGYVKSITSETPVYPVDFVGDYPDVIMEGQADTVTVAANGFTPVYVRVNVDRQVPAGNYSGTVRIGIGDKFQTVDVKLKVYDFTLPATSSCKVVFSFFESFYAEWYGYKTLSDAQKMTIYDFLLKYRITPNNIYSENIYPELKFMPELKKKGANFCTLGYVIKDRKLSEEELKTLIETYRQRIDAVKKAGFTDMTYLYAFDELHMRVEEKPGMKEASKQIMTAFRQALPSVKVIQTSPPRAFMIDDYDIFIPLFQYFDAQSDEVRQLKKKGKSFWWYAADTPVKPYPNFFLDYPVLDHRIIFTLSYMYNLDGVLYWCINREWATNMDIKDQWPGKNWKPYILNCFNQQRHFKNGMGNYVYPGKDGRILPSLRLENLRDGIEDYEYLTMLRKQTEMLKLQQAGNKLIGEAEKMLTVPSSVAKSVRDYSDNPANLQQYRNSVAVMIEQINRQLK